VTIAAYRPLDTPRAAALHTRRDGSIDAVRATLLVTVVALHALMVGVSVGAAGPVLENALEGRGWFAPVSWVVQVMPLFFIVGGFSSATQWRSMRARGATPSAYVRGRVERLVRPAIALVAIVGAALVTMTLAGVPADIVATAGHRIGQPLWFLGVYILCSALVPAMVRAHERARVATPLLLLAAVVAVDAIRLTSGIDAVGFLNLLFVWLLVQQLGFWLADGAVDRLRRRTRTAVLVAALGALVLLASGPYPADMFVNLNPPTVCLVVLGAAQLMVFSLLRARFSALAAWAPARRAIAVLGERGMTVYLWHLPVLIALAAVMLVLEAAVGLPLPEPVSPEWWASRPLWLAAIALAVAPVVAALSRFERGGRAAPPAGAPLSVALDAVLGAGGVAVVLVAGFGPAAASVALVLLTVALLGTARIAAVAPRYRAGSFERMTPGEPSVDARFAAAS
jgi:peptidoglycan/LPS O-acetylase OafA/YrhL